MELRYLDSSALVKAYLAEDGSERVRQIISADAVVTSMLSIAEIASALARRVREQGIGNGEALAVFRTLILDLESFVVVEVSRTLIDEAARHLLVGAQPVVRTLDAIHLATAIDVFGRVPDAASTLVTADRRLYDAALAAGIRAEDPTPEAPDR